MDGNNYDEGSNDARGPGPVTPEELRALATERTMFDESEAEQSKRMFRESLVGSTYAVVQIAQYSPNEKLRYEAARYVIERNLGRLLDGNELSPTDDPLGELLAEVVREEV